MIHPNKRTRRKNTLTDHRGQAMTEFALTIPIFLLVVFGIIEFGRLFVAYSSVYAAAREAARYGAAVEDIGSNTPRYQDCAGMRAAAQRVGFMGFLDDPTNQITINYINASDFTSLGSCTTTPSGFNPVLGDRVRVVITSEYQPIIGGIVPKINISSTAIRTIVSKISVDQRQ